MTILGDGYEDIYVATGNNFVILNQFLQLYIEMNKVHLHID